MTENEKKSLAPLIPHWNNGSKEAARDICKIIYPWVVEFSKLALLRKKNEIKVANNLTIPTPFAMWDEEEHKQEVLLAFIKSQNSVTKLTTPLSLYKLIKTITHRILLNKIKALTNQCNYRTSINDIEEAEVNTANESRSHELVLMLEHLELIAKKHPEKTIAYSMYYVDGHSTQEISDILDQSLRSVQRHIKMVGIELKAHLLENKTTQ